MAKKKLGSVKGTDLVQLSPADLAADVGATILPSANGGTGFGSWITGDMILGFTTGNTLKKLAGTTDAVRRFLTMKGTGSVSADPAWELAIQSAAVTANVTNATTTLANATGLVFTIGANETWVVDFVLKGQATVGTTGVKLAFTAPASFTAANCAWEGNTTGITAQSFQQQATITTATTVVFWGVATTNLIIYGSLYIQNGANAGTVQLQFAALGASTTIQISAGSYMKAMKV